MEVILVFIGLIAAMVILTIVDIVMNWLMMRRIDNLGDMVFNQGAKLYKMNEDLTRHIKEEKDGKEEKV